MEALNERLLNAWLTLSTVVNNERLVSHIPFNEAYVCHLLYRQKIESPEESLTATDLCSQTRMLKSQMNKVLTSLENRGMIERVPASDDRRKAYIRLREDNLSRFEAIHADSLKLVDRAIEKLGPEKASQLAELLAYAAECVDEMLSENTSNEN